MHARFWLLLPSFVGMLAAPPVGLAAGAPPPADKPGAAAKPATPPPAAPASAALSPSGSAAAPAPAEAAANRPKAAEVVAQLQKVYERTANLKARFQQTLSGPMGKRQASGTVYLKKPGKMRWDYEKPEKKLFVADGTTLWVYEPEDEQAFKQALSSSQLPAQVSFLFGRGKLMDDFIVSYYLDAPTLGEPGDFVLKLVPKVATAQYQYLIFVVNPHNYLVKETVLRDQQGGSNHLVFSTIEPNMKTGIDDARFQFSPPQGTKIISPNR